jgi:PTS system nitrogen regulatory IIA component
VKHKSGVVVERQAPYRLIEINRFLPSLQVHNTKQIFQTLAAYAAREIAVLPSKTVISQDIAALLGKAEETLSSAVGNGVAIPAITMKNIKKPYLLCAKLNQPVMFEGPDEMPVDLVFLIISPDTDGPLHLQRLSRISRMMRAPENYSRLRGAESEDAMRAILENANDLKVAA